MVVCSNCGADDQSGYFCGQCGASLVDDKVFNEFRKWSEEEKISEDTDLEGRRIFDDEYDTGSSESESFDNGESDEPDDGLDIEDEGSDEDGIDEFLEIIPEMKDEIEETVGKRQEAQEKVPMRSGQVETVSWIELDSPAATKAERDVKVKDLTRDTSDQISYTTIYDQKARTDTFLSRQYPEKTVLSISKRGDEYEVALKTSEEGGDASELCDFIKVSPGSRSDLIDQINDVVTLLNVISCTRLNSDGQVEWEEDHFEELNRLRGSTNAVEEVTNANMLDAKINELSAFGKLLYSMFLPVPIQKHLETINEPLILKTNDNEIPWELMYDEKDFLCLKMPIGRKLRSREIPRVNHQTKSDKIKILFIANATGDLNAAEQEVDYIISNLGPDVEVDLLKRHSATSALILSALRNGKYDIIHYAGHAEFNMDSPDESALISYNNNKIYAQEIKRILAGKPFVFLNSCSSGKEKLCEDGKNYTGSDTEGLASSFILGGAMAFIGASWPMPDISAGILASEFYKHFLGGESIGEALRKARLHLKETRPKDINWMAFTLYGDPTKRFLRMTDS